MCQFCMLTRRRVLGGLTATAALASTASFAPKGRAAPTGTALPSEPVILGAGQYRYRVLPNWGQLPPGFTYRDTAAVCVDSHDNVYVFTRGAHPVIVYDREGKLVAQSIDMRTRSQFQQMLAQAGLQ